MKQWKTETYTSSGQGLTDPEFVRACWGFAFGANVAKFYSEQVFDPDIHRRGRDEGTSVRT